MGNYYLRYHAFIDLNLFGYKHTQFGQFGQIEQEVWFTCAVVEQVFFAGSKVSTTHKCISPFVECLLTNVRIIKNHG